MVLRFIFFCFQRFPVNLRSFKLSYYKGLRNVLKCFTREGYEAFHIGLNWRVKKWFIVVKKVHRV